MTDGSPAIELSRCELHEITGYAVACARPALAIFERERPDDRRPRAAIDAAQAFADGAERTRVLRDNAWAAHRAAQETRDAGQAAASDAARGRQRVRRGVPPSLGEGHAGQAHPRVGGPCRAGVRAVRRGRSRRRGRAHRAGTGSRASHRGGRLAALSTRPGRWRAGRGADPSVGRVTALIPRAVPVDGARGQPAWARGVRRPEVLRAGTAPGRRRVGSFGVLPTPPAGAERAVMAETGKRPVPFLGERAGPRWTWGEVSRRSLR
ncbi:hypothetical protein SAMN02745673_01761 [Marinactinospora thermotolerans DSM 45154]|uniref:Imm-5-like domain-containing protein n=1 Tax=Marinactinospora thermotolerans DSM 45154 TaxID=1122192 RepID=A0A1T4PE61_9ACTN|nr:hypothetical protein SAMN02745673_01761 [Marinactinospora thermotolerans DSM 45154]